MSALDVNPVINRLTDMIRKRYGCDLQYKPLEDLEAAEKSLLCSLNKDKHIIDESKRILFPVASNKEVLGMAIIENCDEFTERRIKALIDVVHLVVASVNETAGKHEVLQLLERQFNKSPEPTKIIALNKFRNIQHQLNEKSRIRNGFNGKSTFNIPCLIESVRPYDILKMALEVHDHSRRFAFIYFHHLEESVRTNAYELQKLGNISLYVPDITKLNDGELFALLNFLKGERTKNSPQIIAGSTVLIQSVVQHRLVPTEFVDLLKVAFLRMEDEFSVYKSRGLVEYFFDSFKGSQPTI
jgi:hypothetical protein